MKKQRDNCLNFVTVKGDSGKEYPACVVWFIYPPDRICEGCNCFVSLDGKPCERQDDKE